MRPNYAVKSSPFERAQYLSFVKRNPGNCIIPVRLIGASIDMPMLDLAGVNRLTPSGTLIAIH